MAYPLKTLHPGRYLLESYNRTIKTYFRVGQQYLGVFRDWEVGLKTLSEEGLLHIGVGKAPLCNCWESFQKCYAFNKDSNSLNNTSATYEKLKEGCAA